jgi:hypothetical protein
MIRNNNGGDLSTVRFIEDAVEMTTLIYLQSNWDDETLSTFNGIKMNGLGF